MYLKFQIEQMQPQGDGKHHRRDQLTLLEITYDEVVRNSYAAQEFPKTRTPYHESERESDLKEKPKKADPSKTICIMYLTTCIDTRKQHFSSQPFVP